MTRYLNVGTIEICRNSISKDIHLVLAHWLPTISIPKIRNTLPIWTHQENSRRSFNLSKSKWNNFWLKIVFVSSKLKSKDSKNKLRLQINILNSQILLENVKRKISEINRLHLKQSKTVFLNNTLLMKCAANKTWQISKSILSRSGLKPIAKLHNLTVFLSKTMTNFVRKSLKTRRPKSNWRAKLTMQSKKWCIRCTKRKWLNSSESCLKMSIFLFLLKSWRNKLKQVLKCLRSKKFRC